MCVVGSFVPRSINAQFSHTPSADDDDDEDDDNNKREKKMTFNGTRIGKRKKEMSVHPVP